MISIAIIGAPFKPFARFLIRPNRAYIRNEPSAPKPISLNQPYTRPAQRSPQQILRMIG